MAKYAMFIALGLAQNKRSSMQSPKPFAGAPQHAALQDLIK